RRHTRFSRDWSSDVCSSDLTFSGSSQSRVSGLPVFTPQNPQERVHTFPRIINVAVPSPQHSPIFGQLPEVQIVCKLYLSTSPLRSEERRVGKECSSRESKFD